MIQWQVISEETIVETDRIDVNGKAIYAQKALEVDFIASKGDIKYYIQSALSMDDADKQLQEKRSLYYIDDSLKKIVVAKTERQIGIVSEKMQKMTICLKRE